MPDRNSQIKINHTLGVFGWNLMCVYCPTLLNTAQSSAQHCSIFCPTLLNTAQSSAQHCSKIGQGRVIPPASVLLCLLCIKKIVNKVQQKTVLGFLYRTRRLNIRHISQNKFKAFIIQYCSLVSPVAHFSIHVNTVTVYLIASH